MTKTEFVLELASKLSLLPWEEIEDRISFYVEMIDDRMEEGVSEEEAVAAIGSVDEIASQIIAEIPLAKLVKEKIKPIQIAALAVCLAGLIFICTKA